MVVLGLDPGARETGWGVLAGGRAAAWGVISTPEGQLGYRLLRLCKELDRILNEHPPDVVAMEAVVWKGHPGASLAIGAVRGVAHLLAAQRGLAVVEIAPAQVKKALVGSGRAHKEQIEYMVKALLGADARSHAADALAVAYAASVYSSSSK